MLRLDRMVIYVLLFVITVSSAFTSPVLNGYRQHRLSRHKRDIQGVPVQIQQELAGPLMRMLFKEKSHLLNFLSTRSHEEKRQRQCYWSVISCY